jgi:hypothetical protein
MSEKAVTELHAADIKDSSRDSTTVVALKAGPRSWGVIGAKGGWNSSSFNDWNSEG